VDTTPKRSLIFLALLAIAAIIAVIIMNRPLLASSLPASSENSAASQKAMADSALQQAQQQEANANAAAANETAQAQAAGNSLADADAATAQALEVARAQLAMTADAANFSSTQSAIIVQQTAQALALAQQQAQATATAQVLSNQQTSQALVLAQEQSKATATAQAMQREGVTAQQAASASQRQTRLLSWLIPVAAAIAFGLVLLLGAKFISGMIDSVNERRSLEIRRLALLGTLFEAPSETIVFADPQSGFIQPPLLNSPDNSNDYDTSSSLTGDPMIDDEVPPVIVVLSKGDRLLADRAEVREEIARCTLAMKLLRDAINQAGAQSNCIPSAAQLGWPAGAWAIAVSILKPYGAELRLGGEGGIYLAGQYPTLQALYIAIGEKRLSLYPPSAESETKN
jgi:hypothetical protein